MLLRVVALLVAARPARTAGKTATPKAPSPGVAAVQHTMRRSVDAYPRIVGREGVERYLAALLEHDDHLVVVLDQSVFVTKRFLVATKHRKHAMLLKSAAKYVKLPNMAYLFDRDSTGESLNEAISAAQPGAQGLPVAVISKRQGHATPGILVPNPFFAAGNLTDWGAFAAGLRRCAAAAPWAGRDARLFWRGNIGNHGPLCGREGGNYARLAAMSLTLEDATRFDVRCAKCHPRDDLVHPCPAHAYDAQMRQLARDNCSAIRDGAWWDPKDYARSKFVLNLPGTTSGGYSRNLNHLWSLGAVVVLWACRVAEWYYPALRDGETHVTVDKANASETLDSLGGDARWTASLTANAKRVYDDLLCPQCQADYMRAFGAAIRDRFELALVLDDARAAASFFGANCATRDFVEVVADAKWSSKLVERPVPRDSPLARCGVAPPPPERAG
ncbi:hypothetical protein M885DRAFT_620972 [Pelagophyceae sp. CCMP2097]|nr:hypothetical protein M885DRAFT_620972 [Pelagophyceae sp. CCMP2097]